MGFALSVAVFAQDKPQDVPKNQLPAKASCVVCTVTGFMPGDLKPVAGVMYKGKAYYFCQRDEVGTFKKDPEAFVTPILPRPMTAFDLTDTSGNNWNANAFNNKLVLIDYWATWCVPCRELAPELDALHAKYKPQGLQFLSVATMDQKKDFNKFIAQHPFDHPVLFDDKGLNKTWHVVGVPDVFLVKDGQVVAQWLGVVKREAVEEAIKGALSPKAK